MGRCLAAGAGLDDALEHGAVGTCVTLLDSFDSAARRAAAETLARLCFAEAAKISAIEKGAVSVLIKLLEDDQQAVRRAACGALVAMTTTDEGKRQIVAPDGSLAAVDVLIGLLDEGDAKLTTNALKLVANAAVHPLARARLRETPSCLASLDALLGGPDALNAKHAEIAKDAVLWEP